MFRRIWIRFLQSLGFDPRGIFTYWDGRKWRHVDPIVVGRRLWSVNVEQRRQFDIKDAPLPFDSENPRKLIKKGDWDSVQRGLHEIAEAVRYAFQLNTFDGRNGCSELECLQILEKFESYMSVLKKNGSGLPITSTSTDTSLDNESPTSNGSDSGSTSTAVQHAIPDVSGLADSLTQVGT